MWARRTKDESGFTLTELLIVIVILGILTGIVVFAVGAFTDRGQVAACKSDLKAVEVAAEAYRAKEGNYPADVAGPPAVSAMQLLVNTNYLRELPRHLSSDPYQISLESGTGKVSATGLAGCTTP
jgi:general secretion pathway protein G